MVLLTAGSQVDWVEKLSNLAKVCGKEVGLDLIPYDSTLTSESGPVWMFSADFEGFFIYHLEGGALEKRQIPVDDQNLVIDTEIFRQQVLDIIHYLSNRKS